MSLLSDDEDAHFLFDSQSNPSSSGDDDDDEPFPPPFFSQNHFTPPFYGRPPTPLPPSPSLTSLLRPSRPTTPDPSDDDIEPVPRASPKVPTYEYYGFVVYLFSSFSFLIYLLWAYLPSPFLHALGIYYYPNRWWALAIPAFISMSLVYIYVALALYNTEVLTLPLTSIETIVDEAAKIATIDNKGHIRFGDAGDRKHQMTTQAARRLDWKNTWNKGTDAVMDVPLAGVCEVLYGNPIDEVESDSEDEEQWQPDDLQSDTLSSS
ncbi:PIG-P-domain-containing protein [Xylaria sp. CBS 124048]|nr:PIG-P-domain-containing protein [Xylaria sp. CBS 124048]